ncbi:hypothetical protein AX777_12655 [Sphingobium yanoikuyae]|jgi:hypothetical protein|uniref:Uncharacterized protein n=1 Tax=Sphingobium yanoikuyae TaxID=13690 RepID=A0A177JT70_SPHYA|nr:hypothetical protein [Sphingobium yanoikuyae]OAH43946.1 hypothetical protein AX777_12655 [Sphingobium yanoikuyae]PZU64481.1 MAG: hypothetical protein DI554_08605 [Sphingobium sp.]
MPLTLGQFLFSIPVTLGVLFLPFLVGGMLKNRPLKPLLIAYVIVSALLVAFFSILALFEHLNK